jgi:hypothetical protein
MFVACALALQDLLEIFQRFKAVQMSVVLLMKLYFGPPNYT